MTFSTPSFLTVCSYKKAVYYSNMHVLDGVSSSSLDRRHMRTEEVRSYTPPPLPKTSTSSNSSVLFVCPTGSVSSMMPTKNSSSQASHLSRLKKRQVVYLPKIKIKLVVLIRIINKHFHFGWNEMSSIDGVPWAESEKITEIERDAGDVIRNIKTTLANLIRARSYMYAIHTLATHLHLHNLNRIFTTS